MWKLNKYYLKNKFKINQDSVLNVPTNCFAIEPFYRFSLQAGKANSRYKNNKIKNLRITIF